MSAVRFVFASAAALLVSAGAAAGQDWSGSAVGLEVTGSSLLWADVEGELSPGRASGFTYVAPGPAHRFSSDRSVNPKVGAALSYGRLFDRGSHVLGLEAELAFGPKQRFALGPFESDQIVAYGPGTVGYITTQQDRIEADLQLQAALTLKASAGLKLGDKTLVSVFAGPSVARARMRASQAWDYGTLYTYLPPNGFHFQYVYGEFSESGSAASARTVFGVVVGGETRYRLTDRLTLRSQTSFRRYQPVTTTLGGTRFSTRPQVVTGTVGLLYQF